MSSLASAHSSLVSCSPLLSKHPIFLLFSPLGARELALSRSPPLLAVTSSLCLPGAQEIRRGGPYHQVFALQHLSLDTQHISLDPEEADAKWD